MTTRFDYKRSDDGELETDGDGNPVIVTPSGKEQSLGDVVHDLRKEAGDRRAELRKVEGRLEELAPIAEVVTESGLDADALRDALARAAEAPSGDDVDALKARAERAEKKAADATKKANDEILRLGIERDEEKLARAFSKSSAVEETVYLPEHAQNVWGEIVVRDKHGRVSFDDDGNPLALDADGNEVTLDEALRSRFAADPRADQYHKPTQSSGTGLRDDGNGETKTGLRRSKMSTRQKAAYLREHGKQAYDKIPA